LNLLIYGVLNSALSSLDYTTLNDTYKETYIHIVQRFISLSHNVWMWNESWHHNTIMYVLNRVRKCKGCSMIWPWPNLKYCTTLQFV